MPVCFCECVHCVCPFSLLISPFPFSSLSEVLLGEFQHVVLAVLQQPLIQISINRAIQGNPLKIKDWSNKTLSNEFWYRHGERMSVSLLVHLNCLIYLVCSHGGRHGYSDGRWRGDSSRSTSRLCLTVQWQQQEVRSGDWMDAFSRERTRAAEHSIELPTWYTRSRGITANHQPDQTKAHTPGFCVPLSHPEFWSLSAFPLTAGQRFI